MFRTLLKMDSLGNQSNPPPADIITKKQIRRQKEKAKRKAKKLSEKKVYWPPINHGSLVSVNCFRALDYVSQRSRYSEDLKNRLIQADNIKDFDWQSVFRGDEDEELIKHGIEPKYSATDFVNPWPNTSEKCMRLLTLLFTEGKLTYGLQNILLKVDKIIEAYDDQDQDQDQEISEDIIITLLGQEYSHFSNFFIKK